MLLPPATTTTPRVTIDHMAYPHIFKAIIENTPFEFTKTLRATSRYYRDAVDPRLFRHVATQDYQSQSPTSTSLLLVPNLRFPLSWFDPRAAHIQVLDASRSALSARPDFWQYAVAPRLLRFQLGGIFDPYHFDFTAPTAVIFIAPQTLPGAILFDDQLMVSDDPMFPHSDQWGGHFRRALRIPPSIFGVPAMDAAATERLVFNLRINADHEMFAQWEIDFDCTLRRDPFDVYVIATCDCSPLAEAHKTPRGTPRFEGRILNRLILSLGRQMARNFSHVRVTFVDAHDWDPSWLASSYVDKASVFETDEDDLDNAETATMEDRIQYWLNAAVENQFVQFWGDQLASDVEDLTRFITFAEFRAEIPENDFVFQKILCP